MDSREVRVIFNWRRRMHRIAGFIFITLCTLFVAGLVGNLAMDDAVDREVIQKNRKSVPRLLRMEEKQHVVMVALGGTLLLGIAVSGGLLLVFWRCPACGKFLGAEFSPRYCPRCGADFCGKQD